MEKYENRKGDLRSKMNAIYNYEFEMIYHKKCKRIKRENDKKHKERKMKNFYVK
jgi:hypothetical protein